MNEYKRLTQEAKDNFLNYMKVYHEVKIVSKNKNIEFYNEYGKIRKEDMEAYVEMWMCNNLHRKMLNDKVQLRLISIFFRSFN